MSYLDLDYWLDNRPRLSRLLRKIAPGAIWDGSGQVVRKSYIPSTTGSTLVTTGNNLVNAVGSTPHRWVLVITDCNDKEHYISVSQEVWDAYEIDDNVEADKLR